MRRSKVISSGGTLLGHAILVFVAYLAIERGVTLDPKSELLDVSHEHTMHDLSSSVAPDEESQAGYNESQVSEGIAEFNQSLKVKPNDIGAYIDRGWSYSELGQYKLAVADLTRAIEICPGSSEAYCKRAWVYITVGQFRKGLTDANLALSLDAHNSDAKDAREYALAHLAPTE